MDFFTKCVRQQWYPDYVDPLGWGRHILLLMLGPRPHPSHTKGTPAQIFLGDTFLVP